VEGGFLNKLRTIRTTGDVLWHVQLACDIPAYDGHTISQINHDRENRDLYGRHPNFHPNHGGTSRHSKMSVTNTSR